MTVWLQSRIIPFQCLQMQLLQEEETMSPVWLSGIDKTCPAWDLSGTPVKTMKTQARPTMLSLNNLLCIEGQTNEIMLISITEKQLPDQIKLLSILVLSNGHSGTFRMQCLLFSIATNTSHVALQTLTVLQDYIMSHITLKGAV